MSRSRSPGHRKASRDEDRGDSFRDREEDRREVTASMQISDEDAAFILGTAGKTKHKLGRVSGATLSLDRGELCIRGHKEAVDRAKSYCEMVMAQRVGPVKIPDGPREDLTVLEVPAECVAYVTGRRGGVLRMIEEEFGTIMFFAEVDPSSTKKSEKLAIFGPERARRGSELKVMSAIEQKVPGHFTEGLQDHQSSARGFATDVFRIAEEDYSYALGKEGATRRKLGRAAGCLLEYVGRVAFMSGILEERRRCKDYLTWLCEQRVRNVKVHTATRDDVEVLNVPRDCIAFITGPKGSELRAVEDRTDSFCFLDGDKGRQGEERLLIFSYKRSNRLRARELVEDRIELKLRGGGRGGYRGGRDDYYDRDRDRGRYRSRSPGYRGGGRDRSRSRDRGHRDRYDDRDRDRGGRDNGRSRGRSRSRSPRGSVSQSVNQAVR